MCGDLKRDAENILHQNSLKGKKAAQAERTNQHYMIKYLKATEKLRELGKKVDAIHGHRLNFHSFITSGCSL